MREPGQIKRSPRVDTNFEANLTNSDGGRMNVFVTDISREGCRLETEEDAGLKIGEQVEIKVDRYGSFPAQIRWALGREAGAVFLEAIDPDRLDNGLI